MKKIIVIGGGGHAQSIIDSIKISQKYEIVGYTDLYPKNIPYMYLGTDEVLTDVFEKGVRYAVVGIGYTGKGRLRDRLYSLLKQIGYELPVIIDKSAIVSDDAFVDEGSFIGKCVSVNAGTTIGKMCIINTHAIVEHTSRVGNYSHVSVGTTLCGDVVIEDHCFIGANTTIIQGIRVKHDSIIGAGSVVLSNINPDTTCYGIIK